MNREQAIQHWKSIVFDNASSIDPENEYRWSDIALGFFLALGFNKDEAYDITEELYKRGIA
jgi:hypothetical protein